MSNMSYCRFENTRDDLEDCLAHINDELSDSEVAARQELLRLCADILDSFESEK